MRAVFTFVGVAAGGALSGVAAQSATECSSNWVTACDSNRDYTVHPQLEDLPECKNFEDCKANGLTGCGYDERQVTKEDGVYVVSTTATNREMWLDSDGDLQSAIDNAYFTPERDTATCGTDLEQRAYLDPLMSITVKTTGADDTFENGFTSCFAHSGFTDVESGVQYPTARRPNVANCRKTRPTDGRPTCRCRPTPHTSGAISDCKQLHDEARTSNANSVFNAKRLRAFQAVFQCVHYEAPQCSNSDQCLEAGANLNKQCTNSSPCTTNQNFIGDFAQTATSQVCELEKKDQTATTVPFELQNSCFDSAGTTPLANTLVNAGLVPGSADERCSCVQTDCDILWQRYIAVKAAAEATEPAADDEDKNEYKVLERQMTALERAGNCRGGRPGTQTTTTPKPDYSMHIGIIAGIAAASVAVAALITSALICILMYACRSDSHVQTQAQNQRAMMGGAAPGGQSAIYGRSAYGDMEMTHRRSRAY